MQGHGAIRRIYPKIAGIASNGLADDATDEAIETRANEFCQSLKQCRERQPDGRKTRTPNHNSSKRKN